MSREAMKLALEALEEIALAGMSVAPEMIDSKEAFHARQAWRFIGIAARAMEPVKKALAEQPAQQEPVAWGKPTDEMVQAATDEYDEWANENKGTTECIRAMLSKALKASPPAQRKPLTDDEIANILPDDDTPMSLGEAFVKFARAIEAAHGIKGDA